MSEFPSKELPTLSIKQPWASLIVHGGKDIENRNYRTNYRGPIFIHASKKVEYLDHLIAWAFLSERSISIPRPVSKASYKEFPVGGIIGMADLVDCVDDSSSKWFVGKYGWVLENVRALKYVAKKGALGLWKCSLERMEPFDGEWQALNKQTELL